MTICSIEGCEKPLFAKAMCAAHYSRVRRHGGTERVRMSQDAICSFDGCDERTKAKGLCSAHYEQRRPELNAVWKLLRSRAKGAFPIEWMDYDNFCEVVGERPSPAHQLRRLDKKRPWSAENFVWLEPIGLPASDPYYQWVWNLRTSYNLSPEDVQAIIDHQGGVCPVCTKPLGEIGPTSRQNAEIVIEHDHCNDGRPKHFAVRGVTHKKCNSSMGLVNDDSASLRRAADHLDEHSRRKALGISILDEIKKGEV